MSHNWLVTLLVEMGGGEVGSSDCGLEVRRILKFLPHKSEALCCIIKVRMRDSLLHPNALCLSPTCEKVQGGFCELCEPI